MKSKEHMKRLFMKLQGIQFHDIQDSMTYEEASMDNFLS